LRRVLSFIRDIAQAYFVGFADPPSMIQKSAGIYRS
jgi:hypothetical protein